MIFRLSFRLRLPNILRLDHVLRLPCGLIEAASWIETGPDMQKDYFCPGAGIWIWKCPDNLFGQISSLKGYKSKYYGVSCTIALKLVFI